MDQKAVNKVTDANNLPVPIAKTFITLATRPTRYHALTRMEILALSRVRRLQPRRQGEVPQSSLRPQRMPLLPPNYQVFDLALFQMRPSQSRDIQQMYLRPQAMRRLHTRTVNVLRRPGSREGHFGNEQGRRQRFVLAQRGGH